MHGKVPEIIRGPWRTHLGLKILGSTVPSRPCAMEASKMSGGPPGDRGDGYDRQLHEEHFKRYAIVDERTMRDDA
jgi:hypothetical protein